MTRGGQEKERQTDEINTESYICNKSIMRRSKNEKSNNRTNEHAKERKKDGESKERQNEQS